VGVRVLVIDDSDVFLEAASQVVRAIPGFRLVGGASSGEHGIELASTEHPDLVIVDVILPGIDGLETCRQLRRLDPQPFIIMCSVEDDPRRRIVGLPCSQAPFLSKADFSRASLVRLWQEQTPPDASDPQAQR
jgi:DNA-binding NarL/FixJ family response regulator